METKECILRDMYEPVKSFHGGKETLWTVGVRVRKRWKDKSKESILLRLMVYMRVMCRDSTPPNLAHQILWANTSTGIIQHQIPERSGYVSDLVATLQWQESRQC